MTFRREPFLIGHLAGQAVEAVQPFARKFGVGLHLATTDGQQLAVAGDVERTLQVMDNLLSNAIKFSPVNSTVEIADRRGRSLGRRLGSRLWARYRARVS